MVNKHCVMDIGTTSLILRQRPLNKLQLALSGESGQFDGAMVLIFFVRILVRRSRVKIYMHGPGFCIISLALLCTKWIPCGVEFTFLEPLLWKYFEYDVLSVCFS